MAVAVSLAPGRILGRYELLAPIARGGMAEVWAARLHGSRGFQRIVAVKTIASEMIDEAGTEQMLLHEASLASRIQHPNVTATLDLGEQDGVLFLVMEWVDGESLAVLLEQARHHEPIPLAIAVNLIGQACQGLHCAHELRDDDGAPLGIVHRDISPQNVLVTHTGTVKLVDFGIAKATNALSDRTEAGAVKGKFAYMAPEQVRGEAIDRRTDVFAMGILLYVVTTGRHPYKAATPGETIHRLLSEIPIRPSEFIANYPQSLEDIVLKALNKEMGDRFADARELFDALARAVPQAFQPGFESSVAQYLEALLGPRGTESKARLRLAQQVIDGANKEPTVVSGEPDSASIASLRALVVDAGASSGGVRSLVKTRTTLASHAVEELGPPGRSRDRVRFKLLLSAVAILVVAGAIAVRSSPWQQNHRAVDQPAPAAAAAQAPEPPIAPMPIEAAASASGMPLSAAGAASAREISKGKASPLDPARRARHPTARGINALQKPVHVPATPIAAPPAATGITRDPLENRY